MPLDWGGGSARVLLARPFQYGSNLTILIFLDTSAILCRYLKMSSFFGCIRFASLTKPRIRKRKDFEEEYRVQSTIGHAGAFGKVRAAQNIKTGDVAAVVRAA